MVLQTYTVSIVQVKMRNCVVRQVQPSCSWVYNRAETPYKWEGGVNLWKDNTIEIWGEKNPFFSNLSSPAGLFLYGQATVQYLNFFYYRLFNLTFRWQMEWHAYDLLLSPKILQLFQIVCMVQLQNQQTFGHERKRNVFTFFLCTQSLWITYFNKKIKSENIDKNKMLRQGNIQNNMTAVSAE